VLLSFEFMARGRRFALVFVHTNRYEYFTVLISDTVKRVLFVLA